MGADIVRPVPPTLRFALPWVATTKAGLSEQLEGSSATILEIGAWPGDLWIGACVPLATPALALWWSRTTGATCRAVLFNDQRVQGFNVPAFYNLALIGDV